jgi:Family of unknown function (DUF5675)
MDLRLERKQYKADSTIGELFVDGSFECFTLEDGIRTNKVYGQTAIPAGSYFVVVNYSPRFKTTLPLLRDVPRFEGIRIHPGNAPKDTLGCILVGRNWKSGAEQLTASRAAFAPLKEKILAALQRGEGVQIRVIQENAPPDLAARSPRREYRSTTRRKNRSKRKLVKVVAKKVKASRSRRAKKRLTGSAARRTTRCKQLEIARL